MDTWATSSLTPQIAGRWDDDADLFARVVPDGPAPAGPTTSSARGCSPPSCARTTSTASLPWTNAAIVGLDPRPRPQEDVEVEGQRRHADGACSSSTAPTPCATGRRRPGPGVDTAFDEGQMKIGRKLAIKLLNVIEVRARHRRRPTARTPAHVTEPVDRAMLARLDAVVDEATTAFDGYDYARALERTEAFFWWFCDDYVELVKGRAYGGRGEAAGGVGRCRAAPAPSTLQRLFAPILPFVTDEVVELVAATARPRRRRGRRRVAAASTSGADARALDAVSEVLAGAAGQDRGQAEPAGHRRPARGRPARGRPSDDRGRDGRPRRRTDRHRAGGGRRRRAGRGHRAGRPGRALRRTAREAAWPDTDGGPPVDRSAHGRRRIDVGPAGPSWASGGDRRHHRRHQSAS